jgi:hypothetical protein
MLRRSPLLAVPLAALALFGGGCGESKEEKYTDAFKPVNGHVNALVRDVSRTVTSAGNKSNRRLARQFAGLADRAGQVQTQVKELDPPDDLRSENQALITALRKSHSALRAVQKTASQNKPRGAAAATLALAATTLEVEGARRQLARKVRR